VAQHSSTAPQPLKHTLVRRDPRRCASSLSCHSAYHGSRESERFPRGQAVKRPYSGELHIRRGLVPSSRGTRTLAF